MMKYGDRLAYFAGYKNGVYTKFLEPIQNILIESPDADEDDYLDIQEACTQAVILGHTEIHKHLHIFLCTDSPHVVFPFQGVSLVSPDGEFAATLAQLKLDVKNPHITLYKRRTAKLKALHAIPSKMQQIDGFLRVAQHRAKQQDAQQHRKPAIKDDDDWSSRSPTSTDNRQSKGIYPWPEWSSLNEDGTMLVGKDKNIKVDVDKICEDLGVQRAGVCPAMIVQGTDVDAERCHSKCPTPQLPGHRFASDFIHAKSLQLRKDYAEIKDKVSTRIALDSTSTTSKGSKSSKGKGGKGGKGRNNNKRKRPLSGAEQQLSDAFSSNAMRDGPLDMNVTTGLTTLPHTIYHHRSIMSRMLIECCLTNV